jgi:hypothetical protein
MEPYRPPSSRNNVRATAIPAMRSFGLSSSGSGSGSGSRAPDNSAFGNRDQRDKKEESWTAFGSRKKDSDKKNSDHNDGGHRLHQSQQQQCQQPYLPKNSLTRQIEALFKDQEAPVERWGQSALKRAAAAAAVASSEARQRHTSVVVDEYPALGNATTATATAVSGREGDADIPVAAVITATAITATAITATAITATAVKKSPWGAAATTPMTMADRIRAKALDSQREREHQADEVDSSEGIGVDTILRMDASTMIRIAEEDDAYNYGLTAYQQKFQPTYMNRMDVEYDRQRDTYFDSGDYDENYDDYDEYGIGQHATIGDHANDNGFQVVGSRRR